MLTFKTAVDRIVKLFELGDCSVLLAGMQYESSSDRITDCSKRAPLVLANMSPI
jgi:hypothetical protein